MNKTLADRLDRAMREAPQHVRAADVARAAGVRPPSVSDWLSGKTKSIKAEYLIPVARLLNVEAEWLSTGRGAMRKGGTSAAPVSEFEEIAGIIPPSSVRRIPVVGTASLGMEGYWTDLEYPPGHGDGYFLFPTQDPEAYVLQVRGNSMHPAVRSGWFVVIEPNTAPQMGEFVMIKLRDGRSTVKEFLWHRDGEYVLNAIATDERLVIRDEDVDVIHHVGGILPPSGRQG